MVPDLDEAYQQLVARGIRPRGRPRVKPWGERTFTVADPDGFALEFQE